MQKPAPKSVVLGFMTVRETERGGLRGGYLLTSDYGRPIEFHYTSELRLNPQQQVLYGKAADSCLFAESLGKPMTERQGTAPLIIATDCLRLLELRCHIPAPVVFLNAQPVGVSDVYHGDFPQDKQAFAKIKTIVPEKFDWMEPFDRVSVALAEIRDPDVRLVA